MTNDFLLCIAMIYALSAVVHVGWYRCEGLREMLYALSQALVVGSIANGIFIAACAFCLFVASFIR